MTRGEYAGTIQAALDEISAMLADVPSAGVALGSQTPAYFEASYLMCALLGCGRAELNIRYQDVLPDSSLQTLRDWAARRLTGEPLQYIVGEAPFRQLVLEVNSAVLIPRPETEILVDRALSFLRNRPAAVSDATVRVLDLCTGSGCIALSVATEIRAMGMTSVEVYATDIDTAALAVASHNLMRSGMQETVSLFQGDLFEALKDSSGVFDLILSNPPYVSDAAMSVLPAEVANFEPRRALVGGRDGLDIFRRILADIPRYLAPGGACICELSGEHIEMAAANSAEVFREVEIVPDLTGRPRFLFMTGVYDSLASTVVAVDEDNPDPALVGRAAAALKNGEPVIFPTDTVYGIGVAVRFDTTPERIYELKGREARKPIAWLVGYGAEGDQTDALRRYGAEVPSYAYTLARKFWPGALTLIVRASAAVPPQFLGEERTIALRMPDNKIALILIESVGVPIATSSANISGEPPACMIGDLDESLLRNVSWVLDAGPSREGIASTVVSCLGEVPVIMREGSVTEEMLYGISE